MEKTAIRKITFRKAALCSAAAVAAAVVLPQLVHLLGRDTGTGALTGQILLPMYLPVLLLGFYAGPAAGAAAGIVSPLLSFALTGMPAPSQLGIMTAELFCYGLFAGIFAPLRINPALKALAASASARLLRLAVTAAAVLIFKTDGLSLSGTLYILALGLPGMALHTVAAAYFIKKTGVGE